jgi:glutathione S-transferase
MLDMYVRRLGEASVPLQPRIESEIANHLGFVDGALEGRDYLLGEFSLADIQMSFVGEAGTMLGRLAGHEHLAAWVRRCQDRPAYRVALEKGGPYNMGPKD